MSGATPQASPPVPVPMRLQINDSGAWRNVMSFDMGDENACGRVLCAAPELARASGPKTTLRVVFVGPLPKVWSSWEDGKGWFGPRYFTP